jgi:predicted lipoprotein with Yx(FWY)xxD motif
MRKSVLAMALVAAFAAAGVIGAFGTAASGHSARASVAKAKLQVHSGKLGKFIIDAKGRTLYLFEKDKGGKSACSGACAAAWPPYLTSGKPAAGSGVQAAKVGTTKRRDGTLQATYAGHPLYRFSGDSKAGQTAGEGSKAFGASWYVVAPNGKKIDKS